jgi:hypothetical protein
MKKIFITGYMKIVCFHSLALPTVYPDVSLPNCMVDGCLEPCFGFVRPLVPSVPSATLVWRQPSLAMPCAELEQMQQEMQRQLVML